MNGIAIMAPQAAGRARKTHLARVSSARARLKNSVTPKTDAAWRRASIKPADAFSQGAESVIARCSPIHLHNCTLRMAARWGIECGRPFANAERGLCVEPYFAQREI
jgi:hypothetical protein